MSSNNPYYRSAVESDEQFAQEPAFAPSKHQYHSAYNPQEDISHNKPYFSQPSTFPSAPSYLRTPNVFRQPEDFRKNFFSALIDKYTTKKKNENLTAASLCKNCNIMTESFVVKKNSIMAWILCIFLLITTYVCFFLPFLFDALKNKHVVCKNCGNRKFVVKIW